ncbi:MAG: chemotaxis-specific protein-glutamate methyltransferase CheB, partial [Desulfobacterales bacterium]|nr:chemotaxis-specific protein-glutamate methyltransferase CheB [Desulfobacterales bacterium]
MGDNLKIIVVDDSVSYRNIISKIIAGIKDVEFVGTAADGKIALAKIEQFKPDLVISDIMMPVMNGIELLEIINKRYQDMDVIIVSGIGSDQSHLTVRALELGALDFITKPPCSEASVQENYDQIKNMLMPVISLAKTRKYTREIRKLSSVATEQEPIQNKIVDTVKPVKQLGKKISKIDVIAVGVSTGGPKALIEIIPQLKNIELPILAVQHMPPLFTQTLAERLNKLSMIQVVEAQQGEIIQNGVMYFAPGGVHMIIKKKATQVEIDLIDTVPVNSCKPSVDVLFNSIANVYGGNVLTVILTGMGNDGAKGVTTIRKKGGYSLIQDEKTSVVWGMPGSVFNLNQADEVLPLHQIA